MIRPESEEEKSDAIHTLSSRPAYALPLLQAVEKGRIPNADLKDPDTEGGRGRFTVARILIVCTGDG